MDSTDNPRPPVPSPYLTAVEAARYLRMSTSMLAIWRMNGTGPKYLLCSTRVRYRIEDLDAFVNSGHTRKRVSPNVGRPPKNRKGNRKAAR